MTDLLSSTISGAPNPPPPLSGLLLGLQGYLSGGGADLSGTGGGGLAGTGMGGGMTGGPGIDALSLLLQLQGGGAGGILPPSQLALGQGGGLLGQTQGGGLGQMSELGGFGMNAPFFTQQLGQQTLAGQRSPASSPAAGALDPIALLQKLLGLGATITGLGATPASPTGATGGGYEPPTPSGTASPTSVTGTPESQGYATAGTAPLGPGPGAFDLSQGLLDPAQWATNPMTGNAINPAAYLSGFGPSGGGGPAEFIPAGLTTGDWVTNPISGGLISPAAYLSGLGPSGGGGPAEFLPSPTGGYDTLGSLSPVLGGLGSLAGLYESAKSGNPIGGLQDLYGLYQAVNSLGNLGGPTLSSLLGGAGAEGAGAAAAGAGAGAEGIFGAAPAALSGAAPAAVGGLFAAIIASAVQKALASGAPAGISKEISGLRTQQSQARDAATAAVAQLSNLYGQDLSQFSPQALENLTGNAYQNIYNMFIKPGAPGVTSYRAVGSKGWGEPGSISPVYSPLAQSPQTADQFLKSAMLYGQASDLLSKQGLQGASRGPGQFSLMGGPLVDALLNSQQVALGPPPGQTDYYQGFQGGYGATTNPAALGYFMSPQQSAELSMLNYGLGLAPAGWTDPVTQAAQAALQGIQGPALQRLQSNQPLSNVPWMAGQGPLLPFQQAQQAWQALLPPPAPDFSWMGGGGG